MKNTKTKRPLEQQDIELLDKLISRFGQVMLWHWAWGLLGVVDEKQFEELEARFRKIRQKEGNEFPRTKLNEEYEQNKQFFRELHDLLAEFVARDGLGVEYDKRRAQHLAETALAYKKIASN